MKACSLISLPHRKSVNTKRDSRNYTYRDCIVLTRSTNVYNFFKHFYFTCFNFFRAWAKPQVEESPFASPARGIAVRSGAKQFEDVRRQQIYADPGRRSSRSYRRDSVGEELKPQVSFYIVLHRSIVVLPADGGILVLLNSDAFWGGVGSELRNYIFRILQHAMPVLRCRSQVHSLSSWSLSVLNEDTLNISMQNKAGAVDCLSDTQKIFFHSGLKGLFCSTDIWQFAKAIHVSKSHLHCDGYQLEASPPQISRGGLNVQATPNVNAVQTCALSTIQHNLWYYIIRSRSTLQLQLL